VTDRRTHRQTHDDSIYRASIASRGKNVSKVYFLFWSCFTAYHWPLLALLDMSYSGAHKFHIDWLIEQSYYTVSVRALCNGRRDCRLSDCLSRVISRKLSELYRHEISLPLWEIWVAEQDMTSNFAPEVAKYHKSSPKPQNFETDVFYCLTLLWCVQLDLCLTVVCGQGLSSEILILIATSPESYQQWLKLLQRMTGTVVGDIGKQ